MAVRLKECVAVGGFCNSCWLFKTSCPSSSLRPLTGHPVVLRGRSSTVLDSTLETSPFQNFHVGSCLLAVSPWKKYSCCLVDLKVSAVTTLDVRNPYTQGRDDTGWSVQPKIDIGGRGREFFLVVTAVTKTLSRTTLLVHYSTAMWIPTAWDFSEALLSYSI